MDDHTGRGQSLIKKLSAALFGLVLISFGLPFVAFSIAGVRVASVTGVQFVAGAPVQDLATRRVREIAGLVSRFPRVGATVQSIVSEHVGRIPSLWLAGLVVLCAIVGLGLSFLRSRKSALLPGAVAAIALVALAVLRVGIDNATASKGQGLITAEYGIGYYLIGLLLLAALLLNSYLAWTAWWPTVGRSGRGSARGWSSGRPHSRQQPVPTLLPSATRFSIRCPGSEGTVPGSVTFYSDGVWPVRLPESGAVYSSLIWPNLIGQKFFIRLERWRGAMARVLIVDDDPTIRHLLDDVLRLDEGYETFQAADGQTAVEIAREEQPQVILMDLTLPALSGEAAMRMLKEDERTKGIRIIAMSSGVNLHRHVDELRADGLLGKPFDLDILAANVALQLRHAAVPAPVVPDGDKPID